MEAVFCKLIFVGKALDAIHEIFSRPLWEWFFYYKVVGMLSTDCKNQSLRDRVDYKFDCRLQSSEFREPDFFVVD